jgi:putative cell wall-binding protein
VLGNDKIRYTPDADFNGPDSFTYEVCDTLSVCDTATVNITVNPLDDTPVANDDNASTGEETAVDIDVLGNDTDPDGNINPNTLQVISAPTDGSAQVLGNDKIRYTPDTDFNGADIFTYQICDTTSRCDPANVTVTVNPGGVDRLFGSDRYGTAAAVADAVFKSPDVAYIAVGSNFPDALVAGSKGDGPVLLTTTSVLPTATKVALEDMAPLDEIFVVGGTGVISTGVENALDAYASKVTRIAGADRHATAAEFSKKLYPSADTVFIAYGGNFPDALVASAGAGKLGAPILLVNTDSIPSATASELNRLNPSKIYIVGGTGVISTGVANSLKSYGSTTRLAGADRFSTASAVSSALFPTAANVWIATGLDFPDALVAAGGAINDGGPILLVQTNAIPSATASELGRTTRLSITIVGGTAVVSSSVETQLGSYLD